MHFEIEIANYFLVKVKIIILQFHHIKRLFSEYYVLYGRLGTHFLIHNTLWTIFNYKSYLYNVHLL